MGFDCVFSPIFGRKKGFFLSAVRAVTKFFKHIISLLPGARPGRGLYARAFCVLFSILPLILLPEAVQAAVSAAIKDSGPAGAKTSVSGSQPKILMEWHIRLSVAMASQGLADPANTLGLSPKSSPGPDLLDIPDMPLPPWTENHLELVFPHPEWGGELTGYSSDFRKAEPGKKIEEWRFEVRSNVLNEKVYFAWHGPKAILTRCRLRDGKTGKVLVSDPASQGYSFTMTKPVHEFIWEYSYPTGTVE